MITCESGVPVYMIRDPHVVNLLQSPRILRWFYGMDMAHARWILREGIGSQLILNMRVPSRLRGWSGINHGGGTDFIIHDVAGFAALLEARRHDKIVLGHSIQVGYMRPLPLLTPVQVIATIDQSEGDVILSSGVIRFVDPSTQHEKVYARGVLRTKMVSEIRPTR